MIIVVNVSYISLTCSFQPLFHYALHYNMVAVGRDA